MFDLKLTFEGVDQIPKLTDKQVSKITKKLSVSIRQAMIRATPVDSGEAKTSWTPLSKVEGGWSFGNIAPYAYYLEHGSEPGKKPWPTVGSSTVFYQGKIYSSQAPGGISANAGIDILVRRVAKKLVREALLEKG